jgi:hypothetical protein
VEGETIPPTISQVLPQSSSTIPQVLPQAWGSKVAVSELSQAQV